MKTTNLFIELLVGGLGFLLWLAFLFIGIFGTDSLEFLLSPKKISGAVVVMVSVGLTYIFGIICDRIYQPIWSPIDKFYMEKQSLSLDDYYSAQVTIAASEKEYVISLLNFYTSRMRILRASMVNFALAGFIGSWAYWGSSSKIGLFILILFEVLAISALASLVQITEKYYKKVSFAIENLQ